MIAIIDYGVGNLFSIQCSFNRIGYDCIVSGDEEVIRKADKLLLPGVGAYADASKKLFDSGLDKVIKEEVANGKELLGICLGMQLLFDKSHEFGINPGLGLIPGDVIPMNGNIPKDLKIPQIGWNGLNFKKECKLLKYIHEGDSVYFVHSFYASNCEENLVATTEYGIDITAIVQKDNVYGCQFHPEKSGDVGLKILKAFCEG